MSYPQRQKNNGRKGEFVMDKAKIIRAMARDSKSLYLIYRTAGNPPITSLRLVIETLRTTR